MKLYISIVQDDFKSRNTRYWKSVYLYLECPVQLFAMIWDICTLYYDKSDTVSYVVC